MSRCVVCNGRTIKTETGRKCAVATCEGADEARQAGGEGHQKQILCRCGEEMAYRGLTSYGEPRYVCMACGATTKL
jgi:hypothetical protein